MDTPTNEAEAAKAVLFKEASAIQEVANRLNIEKFSRAIDILFQERGKIIITGIGKSGYVRDRESEFSLKDISRTELINQIENLISIIESALSTMEITDLDKEYPLLVFKEKTTTGHFLIHLATHLSYHLGQVNYHRRLLDF